MQIIHKTNANTTSILKYLHPYYWGAIFGPKIGGEFHERKYNGKYKFDERQEICAIVRSMYWHNNKQALCACDLSV